VKRDRFLQHDEMPRFFQALNNEPNEAARDDVLHLSRQDAERAFDFAEALAQFLYIIPSRMPTEPDEAGG